MIVAPNADGRRERSGSSLSLPIVERCKNFLDPIGKDPQLCVQMPIAEVDQMQWVPGTRPVVQNGPQLAAHQIGRGHEAKRLPYPHPGQQCTQVRRALIDGNNRLRGALRRLCRSPTRRAAFHTSAPYAARLPQHESEPARRLQQTSDSDSGYYWNSSLSSSGFYQFRRSTRIVVNRPGIRQRTVYGLEILPAPRKASQDISLLYIVATLPHSPGDTSQR
jgi:hypothetical protein